MNQTPEAPATRLASSALRPPDSVLKTPASSRRIAQEAERVLEDLRRAVLGPRGASTSPEVQDYGGRMARPKAPAFDINERIQDLEARLRTPIRRKPASTDDRGRRADLTGLGSSPGSSFLELSRASRTPPRQQPAPAAGPRQQPGSAAFAATTAGVAEEAYSRRATGARQALHSHAGGAWGPTERHEGRCESRRAEEALGDSFERALTEASRDISRALDQRTSASGSRDTASGARPWADSSGHGRQGQPSPSPERRSGAGNSAHAPSAPRAVESTRGGRDPSPHDLAPSPSGKGSVGTRTETAEGRGRGSFGPGDAAVRALLDGTERLEAELAARGRERARRALAGGNGRVKEARLSGQGASTGPSGAGVRDSAEGEGALGTARGAGYRGDGGRISQATEPRTGPSAREGLERSAVASASPPRKPVETRSAWQGEGAGVRGSGSFSRGVTADEAGGPVAAEAPMRAGTKAEAVSSAPRERRSEDADVRGSRDAGVRESDGARREAWAGATGPEDRSGQATGTRYVVNEAQAEARRLQRQVDDLARRLSQLEDEKARLASEAVEARARALDAEETSRRDRAARREAEDTVAQRDREVAAAREASDRESQRAEALQEELNKCRDLASDAGRLEAQLGEAASRQAALEQDLAEARRDAEEERGKRAQVEDLARKLKDKLLETVSRLNASKAKLQGADASTRSLRDENARLKADVDRLSGELSAAAADLDGARGERDRARAEVKRLGGVWSEERARREACERDLEAARQDASTAKAKRDAALERLSAAQAEIDDKGGLLADVEQQITDLEGTVQQTAQENRVLVEQLERVRTEVQDLMGQRGALEGRGRALEAELGQAQEALAHKHAECEQLTRQVQSLARDLEAAREEAEFQGDENRGLEGMVKGYEEQNQELAEKVEFLEGQLAAKVRQLQSLSKVDVATMEEELDRKGREVRQLQAQVESKTLEAAALRQQLKSLGVGAER